MQRQHALQVELINQAASHSTRLEGRLGNAENEVKKLRAENERLRADQEAAAADFEEVSAIVRKANRNLSKAAEVDKRNRCLRGCPNALQSLSSVDDLVNLRKQMNAASERVRLEIARRAVAEGLEIPLGEVSSPHAA